MKIETETHTERAARWGAQAWRESGQDTIRSDRTPDNPGRSVAWTRAGWQDAGPAPAPSRTALEIPSGAGVKRRSPPAVSAEARAKINSWLANNRQGPKAERLDDLRRGQVLRMSAHPPDDWAAATVDDEPAMLALQRARNWRQHATSTTDADAKFHRTWARSVGGDFRNAVVVLGDDVVQLRGNTDDGRRLLPPGRKLARRPRYAELTAGWSTEQKSLLGVEHWLDRAETQRAEGYQKLEAPWTPTEKILTPAKDDGPVDAGWAPHVGVRRGSTVLSRSHMRQRAEADTDRYLTRATPDDLRIPKIPKVGNGRDVGSNDYAGMQQALVADLARREHEAFFMLADAEADGASVTITRVAPALVRAARRALPKRMNTTGIAKAISSAVLGKPGDGRRALVAAVACMAGVVPATVRRSPERPAEKIAG